MAIVVCGLLIGIGIDILLFKKRDLKLFELHFALSRGKAVLGCVLMGIVLVLSENRGEDLPMIILLVMISWYFLRREKISRILGHPLASNLDMLSGAVGVVITWIYGIAVFEILVSGMMELFPEVISQMGELIFSAAFSSLWIIILVYRASKGFSNEGFLTSMSLRKGNRSSVKIVGIPLVLGLFFACFSSYLTVSRQVQPQTPLNEVLETTKSINLILGFVFLAICIAPLVEEIVFRGYFFRVLKEWIGVRKAIYIIASVFAILHVGQYWGDWLAIGMVTLLGFTLTILRAWTGTTLASVITHYVYNGGVTIIPVIMMALSNPAYFEYKSQYSSYGYQEKETLLMQSIKDKPEFMDAYNDLAWLYAQEGKNLEQALELIDKVLEYAPESRAYLDTKREILEKLGRSGEAEAVRLSLDGELP